MTTAEIVKNYICKKIKNDGIDLEDYVREIFKGQDKTQLRKYCRDQGIYYKKSSTREMMLQKIYGICNAELSYKILKTSREINESDADYYKRI